jgi:hypothetical protein
MRFNTPIFGVLAMLSLLGLFGLTGCSTVLPATLETKLASNATAEDHLAAAMLYQNKARELEAEAIQFETAVSKVGSYGDTKGFHRAALRGATQEKRYGATQMQQLYVQHLGQARALYGKTQPE